MLLAPSAPIPISRRRGGARPLTRSFGRTTYVSDKVPAVLPYPSYNVSDYRGVQRSNETLVRYEMVDRLYEGFRAVLARYPRADVVLKVEDDTRVDGAALAALLARPLCDGSSYSAWKSPGGPPPTATPRSSAQPLRKLPPGRARAAALLRRRQRLPLGRADPAAPAARDAAAAGPGGRAPSRRTSSTPAAAWCARVASTPRATAAPARVGSARAAARVRPLRRGHAASVLVRVGLY